VFKAALIYEDEVPRFLRAIAKDPAHEGLTEEQISRVKSNLAGKTLTDATFVAEQQAIPFYLIKSSQFDSLVKGYPTVISCTASSCEDMMKDAPKAKAD